MRSRYSRVFCRTFAPAAMFFLLVGSGSGQNTTRITLDQAVDLALAHNHSLQATRTQILQNQAQEITANLRPNPTLGLDTQFVPFFSPQDFSGENLNETQQFDVGISYSASSRAYLGESSASISSAYAAARRGAKWPCTRARTGPMSSSAGTGRRLACRCAGSTSPSRAAPSRPPSHLSSAASSWVRERGMTEPNDPSVPHSLRVAIRI